MANSKTPLQRLQSLITLEREDIGILITYGIGIGILSLATPVAVQALVNTIAFGALFQPLLVLTLVLLILLGFSNTLVALQFYVVEMLQRRVFVRIFGETATRLQQTRYAANSDYHLPELTNRFFDVVTLQKTASVMLLETLGYVLQTLIGMVLLAFYHPLLLAFDLFFICALAFILFAMGKQGIASATEQSKAKYAAAAWLEDIAANPLLVKSSEHRAYINAQTDRLAKHYVEASTQHFRILSRQNIGALVLHALASTLLLGMGGWMVISNQLSLGQLIAAELVVGAMIYGLTRLGKTLENVYELLASVDKIGYLLDLPQETEQGAAPEFARKPYKVDIGNLSLAVSTHLDAISNSSLQIAPGEQIVISGDIDKGSLLDVVYGLHPPSSGYVCLDGQDLRDLNLGQLRSTIGLVRQVEIFAGNLLDNVRLGRDLNLTHIRKTLDQVGLLETISALPDSLDTHLLSNGYPLTREQCLRLTLARTLAGQPRLLLLDRILDQLDSRILPTLLDHLLATNSPWTLIVTSQRPDIIAHFPRQLSIVNGGLIDSKADNEGHYDN
ncbi:ABC transporter ATP-binding protein [Methyloglobulus sp.]|uniref:ABC transporter ATP-binding protein n=1 Tax=Methyloglobulus sp. TaxID=2518622 RepID=UPI0032B7A81A